MPDTQRFLAGLGLPTGDAFYLQLAILLDLPDTYIRVTKNRMLRIEC